MCVNPNLSIYPSPPFPLSNHKFVFYICVTFQFKKKNPALKVKHFYRKVWIASVCLFFCFDRKFYFSMNHSGNTTFLFPHFVSV